MHSKAAREIRNITLPVWIMGRLGIYIVGALITAGASVLSVIVAWALSLVFEVPDRPLYLAFAGVIPLIVTPIFTCLAAITIRDLKRSRKNAVDMARLDMLTGVSNRRAFFEAARAFAAGPKAPQTSHGVLYIDIDHFKSINDRYGHEGGDVVLKHFAGLLQACTRASDLVARIGGEEFVVYVTNVEPAGLSAIANGVMARLRASVVDFDGRQIRYTASIGGALSLGSTSIDSLLSLADARLYEVKNAGRNGFLLADARVASGPASPESQPVARSAA